MLEYVPLIGAPLRETIRGGTDIGPATLGLFYAIHTAVMPLFLLSLMAFHFWRIRKAGGLVSPVGRADAPIEPPVRVPALPNLLLREVVVASVLVAVVLWLSVFFNAPLSEPANPGLSPNPTKAPWYFAGLQELLLHLHPVYAVFVIPLTVGIALMAIPYLRYHNHVSGVWFISPKGRRIGIIAAITALIFTPFLLIADEWALSTEKRSSAMSLVFSNGIIPVLFLLLAIVLFAWILRRRFSPSKNESVQALFILMSVAFGVLTLVGSCFRGPSMVLTFPW
jgi:quinol-cytochrome oxidoreductase complex cytochrome b subunit